MKVIKIYSKYIKRNKKGIYCYKLNFNKKTLKKIKNDIGEKLCNYILQNSIIYNNSGSISI